MRGLGIRSRWINKSRFRVKPVCCMLTPHVYMGGCWPLWKWKLSLRTLITPAVVLTWSVLQTLTSGNLAPTVATLRWHGLEGELSRRSFNEEAPLSHSQEWASLGGVTRWPLKDVFLPCLCVPLLCLLVTILLSYYLMWPCVCTRQFGLSSHKNCKSNKLFFLIKFHVGNTGLYGLV